MCRRWIAAVIALGVALVSLSSLTALERRQETDLRAGQSARYVDMGIRLIVVERDDVNGTQLVDGNGEKMCEVARYERGGVVKITRDHRGKLSAYIARESTDPVVWYASRAQADLILHNSPVQYQLVQGSEGSGKTTVLAMWVAFRVLEHIGFKREIGITAPTGPRVTTVTKEIEKYWPSTWFRFNARKNYYAFHAGPIVQLLTSVSKSKETGQQGQGNNLVACASDELQDHASMDPNIQARGRSAPPMFRDGQWVKRWYPRLCTSTFKDSPDWRTFRTVAEKACIKGDKAHPLWNLTLLLGLESPFVPLEHWDAMRAGLTEREYQRRVLAMDVGPERQVYYSWRRVDDAGRPANLRPLPLSAVDVTARELSRYGKNLSVLLGNDPGKRQHVTEVLKAYEFPGERRRVDAEGRALPPVVRWFVVDEITSDVYNADHPNRAFGPVTVEHHIDCVLKRVREKWGCLQLDWRGHRDANAPGVVVRIDPHTTTGEEHPSRDVYTQWRAAGFTVFAAAYNSATNKPTPIKVETRIDLVNTLLCNIDKERRLFVLCDDTGRPAAPMLVKAFETMERNERGKAEWEEKDASDFSHWPAAVSFALYSIEKPRIDAYRNRVAGAAA
jgi:hypothetical protein